MNSLYFFRFLLACALALGLLGGATPAPAQAAPKVSTTFIVNDPGDASDAGPMRDGVCLTSGGVCTLRAALEEANGWAAGEPYTITFAPAPSYLIQPTTDLPALEREYTVIDAGAQTVMIRPWAVGSAQRGLQIDANYCDVYNLSVDSFQDNIIVNRSYTILNGNFITNASNNGIELNGGGNILTGNKIGVNSVGAAAGNKYGIVVNNRDNRIGTNGDNVGDTAERNLVSANFAYGIVVLEGGNGTIIAGNWIGLNPAGNAAMGNEAGGILIADVGKGAAINVRIGTDDSDDAHNLNEANVISGNGTTPGTDFGISIEGGSGHIISGNIIGLNPAGAAAIPNTGYAIQVKSLASSVIIGVNDTTGKDPDAMRNIISGNAGSGIYLEGSGHRVAGNIIGLDKNAAIDRGNTVSGIALANSSNIIIGTDGDGHSDADEGNYISGNNLRGILLTTDARNTTIAGNVIGLNKADSAVPNGGGGTPQGGIRVGLGADTVLIGTNGDGLSDDLERNVISGNNGPGVNIGTATVVTVSGNYIGTNIDGSAARPNSIDGVRVSNGAGDIIIGVPNGGNSAQGNLISGNTQSGVTITGVSEPVIAGNWIGLNSKGDAAIPNQFFGVWLTDTSGARVGTDGNDDADKEEKNIISGNWGFNIVLMGDDSAKNWIAGNWIGLDSTGLIAIPHPTSTANTGIGIQSGSSTGPRGTLIGTNGDGLNDGIEGNYISGNAASGILLAGQRDTVVAGNVIGLSAVSAKGSAKVPNGGAGIWINTTSATPPASPVLIGTNSDGTSDSDERNTISGNNGDGIKIEDGGGHTIAGNFIGTDVTGGGSLGNGLNGIHLTATAGTMTVIGTNGDNLNDLAERNYISGNGNNGVLIATNSCTVAGNYIGTDYPGTGAIPNGDDGVMILNGAKNYIGMNSNGSAGEGHEGNLISGNSGCGVTLWGGVQSWVSGNRIGTTASGTAALPNAAHGVMIDNNATAQVIGVQHDTVNDALEGNIISGNNGDGIWVSGTLFTQIFGNTIGLGSDGETRIENAAAGIYLQNTTNSMIGFDNPTSRNLISGNHMEGILISGDNPGASIVGNRIGASASGLDAGNGWSGIRIAGSVKAQNLILAPAAVTTVASNTIQYNGGDGVEVDSPAGRGHKIIDNFFGWNAGLGIDLGFDDGVTPNDGPGDPDGLQNYPLITGVSYPTSGTIRVTGTLNSAANAHFTIQLYAAVESDPTGYGEGIDPLHTFSVNTDASGDASFDETFTYPYGITRSFFTAIAVASDWSTSEFGPNLELRYSFLPMIVR